MNNGPDLIEILKHPERYIQSYPHRTIYLGIVEDAADPDKLGRVRARVESIHPTKTVPTEHLPWAYVANSGGLQYQGGIDIPPNGSAVFVMFLDGDAAFPIVIGGFYGIKGGESEVPKAARGEDDTGASLKGNDTGTGAQGVSLEEPANPAAAVYPDNHVYRSKSGHLIEVDDTEDAERINIVHKSGTWVEFHPDGSIVVGCQKKLYAFTEDDLQIHSKGNADLLADTDVTAKADRDIQTQSTRDNNNVIGRDYIAATTRDWLLTCGRNLTANIAQATALTTGTTWSQTAGSTMALTSATGMTLTDPTTIAATTGGVGSFTAGGALSLTAGAALSIQAATGLTEICLNYLLNAATSVTITTPVFSVNSPFVTLANILPGPIVTTLTHPVDYITGIPILGLPYCLAG